MWTKIHTKKNGIPDLENVQIAILGVLEGRNAHHVLEAQFKAVAQAFKDAVALDPRSGGIPSTKGVLW